MIPTVDCRELYLRLGDDDLVVVDCRSQDEWNGLEAHIPGALWMPPQELESEDAVHALPDDELIVLCGLGPDGSDARRAYRILQLRGRDAVCLEGGLETWVTNGYPADHHGNGEVRMHSPVGG